MTTRQGNHCTVQHPDEKHEIIVRPTCKGTAHTVHSNRHDLLHRDTFGKLTFAHANNEKGKSNCSIQEKIRGNTGHKIAVEVQGSERTNARPIAVPSLHYL